MKYKKKKTSVLQQWAMNICINFIGIKFTSNAAGLEKIFGRVI